jgi:hypothetical protein
MIKLNVMQKTVLMQIVFVSIGLLVCNINSRNSYYSLLFIVQLTVSLQQKVSHSIKLDFLTLAKTTKTQ